MKGREDPHQVRGRFASPNVKVWGNDMAWLNRSKCSWSVASGQANLIRGRSGFGLDPIALIDRGEALGNHPDRSELEEGDRGHMADSRRAYASVLDCGFGTARSPILVGTFELPPA